MVPWKKRDWFRTQKKWLAFDVAGVMLACGERRRAVLWARAGWCYAHRLSWLGDVLFRLAKEGMRKQHWEDVLVMSRFNRVDRKKGLALVGMKE